MSKSDTKVVVKRPYATHYYASVVDKEPAFTSHGACSSDFGAIRATVVRIFIGQYAKALVFDRRDGVLLYTVRIVSGSLKVEFGKGSTDEEGRALNSPNTAATQLRRVK